MTDASLELLRLVATALAALASIFGFIGAVWSYLRTRKRFYNDFIKRNRS